MVFAAVAYQIVTVYAAIRHLTAREPAAGWEPPISILKPVRGRDPEFYRAIRSHVLQDYGEFELLFGVADPDDPAIPEIERLIAAFPGRKIRLIHCHASTPNRKVAVLKTLAAEARYPVLLVNDSDITVPENYLRQVAAPLQDEGVGLVTCLYRGRATRWPGRVEALGVATDFAPGVLVAPIVGVRDFGLGSTLVFRAKELLRIGGFAAIEDYLSDDYQLASRITGAGYRVHLSRTIVDTTLPASTWKEAWLHQVRWQRTIRVSKGAAYWGMIFTHATLWALLAAVAGWVLVAAAAVAVRLAAGTIVGVGVLRCPITARYFWLMPVRDLLGVAVWTAGLWGDSVVWRGRKLHISRKGRILPAKNR